MKHAYFTHYKALELFKAANTWVSKMDVAYRYFQLDADIVSEEMSSYMKRVGDYIDQLERELGIAKNKIILYRHSNKGQEREALEKSLQYIDQLEAENAELKKRLEEKK